MIRAHLHKTHKEDDLTIAEQLSSLASHLAGRHEAVLEAWEEAVSLDPELRTASTLSLAQFRDLIPDLLKDFERKLLASSPTTDQGEGRHSAEHGAHRWKQGYSLRETVREWGHLQMAMLHELETYGLEHPDLAPDVMPFARETWMQLCNEVLTESVTQYSAAQQAEAAGHLQDLQQALERLREADRQRAETWHAATHDLRGNVGLVTSTTSILTEEGVPDGLRTKALTILQSSVSSLFQLLEDLMGLARLEAGREPRHLTTFDAATQLRELCSTLEPLARERGLFLQWNGPEPFLVEGDAAKVHRIVQNLTLNALKYTASGGVTVTWGATRERDADRWRIRIEDTGPGLHIAPGSPIAHKLSEATASSRKAEEKNAGPDVEPVPKPSPPSGTAPSVQQPGEGIGLSIVKRLCELLDAALEVASVAGEGTVFQVVLPRSYENRLP